MHLISFGAQVPQPVPGVVAAVVEAELVWEWAA